VKLDKNQDGLQSQNLAIQIQNSAGAGSGGHHQQVFGSKQPEIISPGLNKQGLHGEKQQKYDYDFYNHTNQYDQSSNREDEEMEIEPISAGNISAQQGFSYNKTLKMVKSHKWNQRAQGLEDFLRFLIEMQPVELMGQLKNEKEFSNMINIVVEKLQSETVIKILEISLDLIELLLSSLPECILP
jgi:hypothetical protein